MLQAICNEDRGAREENLELSRFVSRLRMEIPGGKSIAIYIIVCCQLANLRVTARVMM